MKLSILCMRLLAGKLSCKVCFYVSPDKLDAQR